jgi:hypothetical protein
MLSDKIKFSIDTNVKIEDKNTKEVLVDKCNAIHPQHVALIIARGLSNANYGNISRLALGNGGSYIDSAGNIIYNSPNTSGKTASLYNQTWFEAISGLNSISAIPSNTDLTSQVVVSVTLTSSTGGAIQYPTDTSDINNPANPTTSGTGTTGTGSDFDFDELGLQVLNPLYNGNGTEVVGPNGEPQYLLLTHLVFNPIQKNANRELILTYTLTISVS